MFESSFFFFGFPFFSNIQSFRYFSVRMQIAPGMIQQLQQPCPTCRATGEVIPDKDRCKICDGKKLVQEPKVLEINIERGTANGEKICLYGEGEQEAGLPPGDVNIVCCCFLLLFLF